MGTKSNTDNSLMEVDKIILDDAEIPEQETGINYLFIIGVEQYQHLPLCENVIAISDKLVDLLTNKYRYNPDHIFTLHNSEATASNILKKLDYFIDELEHDDNLLIFYLGHGYLDEDGDNYWLPYEAEIEEESTFLENMTILNFVRQIYCANTLIMSDSFVCNEYFANMKIIPPKQKQLLFGWNFQYLAPDATPNVCQGLIKTFIKILENNEQEKIGLLEIIQSLRTTLSHKYSIKPYGSPLFDYHEFVGGLYFYKKRDEEKDWLLTKEANSVEAYQTFLNNYPESKHENEASAKIAYLTELVIWKNIRDENTAWAYNYYLENYPDGNFAEDAKEQLYTLSNDRYKKNGATNGKRKSQTKASTLQYDQNENSGENKDESISEEELTTWNKAKKDHTVAAFNAYLNAYPKGQFAKEAHKEAIFLSKLDERIAKTEALDKDKQKEMEDDIWKSVVENDTLEAYGEFYKQFPDGKYAEQAKQKIEAFEREMDEVELEHFNEEKAYKQAIAANKLHYYNIFIDKYPDSNYFDEIEKRKEQLINEKIIEKNKQLTKIEEQEEKKPFDRILLFVIGFSIVVVILTVIWLIAK